MPLKYAEFCKICGRVRTKDPSGVCSHCRRSGNSHSTMCKICKAVPTRNSDGICYNCRLKLRRKEAMEGEAETIKEALHDLKRMQFIVEQRLAGKTFSNIAEMMGSTKSSVYKQYQKVLDLFRIRTLTSSLTDDD